MLLDNAERYGHHLARSLDDTNSSQVLSRKNIGKMFTVNIVIVADTLAIDTSLLHLLYQ